MKYYLLFLNAGRVVSVSSFDTEEARDDAHSYWIRYNCSGFTEYDTLQTLNEVN